MSTTKNRSRLGKGLSALIGSPVSVAAPEPTENPAIRAEAPVPHVESGGGGVGIRTVRVSELIPNRYQPRQSFDEAGLERLAESIRTTGMMQPIVVRPARAGDGAGAWEIIAGERRWRAAERAGLDSVPVIVSVVDDQAAAEWALIENLQREDLNPIDRARAFKGLSERFGLSHADIAQRVGLDRSTVANFVRLVELEPEIQGFVRNGVLSTGHAKALLALSPGRVRLELATAAKSGEWSVRMLEERVRRMLAPTSQDSVSAIAAVADPRAAGHEDLERQLGEHLGTRVQIKTSASGTKGSLVIAFFDVQHFDALMERFGFELRS